MADANFLIHQVKVRAKEPDSLAAKLRDKAYAHPELS